MTIKNNGGIFGRNPTFNDVTIEGQLTFDGDIDVNSDLKVDGNLFVTGTGDFDGDLNVNAGSIVVDAGTVNITHPFDRALQINRSGANTFSLEHSTAEMYLYNVTTASPVINFKNNSNVHINSGNLVFGTAGNGIDFSATSGTGTSELFDDYEEGTWTPTIAAGSGTFTTVSAAGRYTKTGRMVIAQLRIFLTDSTGGSGWINISNFPFANSQASYAVAYGESPSGQMIRGTIGASSVNIFEYDNTDPVTNGNYSVTLIYEAT